MNFQDFIEFIKTYGAISILIVFLMLVPYSILKNENPDKLYSASYLYFVIIAIPLLIGVGYIYKISGSVVSMDKTQIMKIVATLVALILVFVGISKLNITDGIASSASFFSNIIGVIILFIAIIICVRVFKDIAYSLEGWLGIGARALFFIPCMISDLFSFTMGQFAKSPFVVYVLIAIEIALILTYIYLPKILAQFAQKSGYQILSNPVLLRNETPISSFANVQTQAGDIPISVATTTNKYSLSMWFYVVKMPGNQYPYNGEGRIFELTNSHPKIVYNGPNNVCRVYYGPNLSTDFKITLQKWVHFVIVYDSANIDIFINGKLVKSVPRIADSIISEPTDQILAGQEKGLQGGLSNIMYYHNAISKQQISVLYDLNKDVDPPIN